MRRFGVALLIAFCSVASARLSAQLQTGRLLGTVLDEQHAAVPGATVTVTNRATNISRVVTSDGEGNYVVTPLEPGIYRISASLQGFRTTVRDRVELTVGQAARVELMLSLGALSTDPRRGQHPAQTLRRPLPTTGRGDPAIVQVLGDRAHRLPGQ